MDGHDAGLPEIRNGNLKADAAATGTTALPELNCKQKSFYFRVVITDIEIPTYVVDNKWKGLGKGRAKQAEEDCDLNPSGMVKVNRANPPRAAVTTPPPGSESHLKYGDHSKASRIRLGCLPSQPCSK